MPTDIEQEDRIAELERRFGDLTEELQIVQGKFPRGPGTRVRDIREGHQHTTGGTHAHAHSILTGITASDHHTKYTDPEAVTAVEAEDPLNLLGDVFVADLKGLVIGHTAQIDFGATPEFQVLGTATPDSSMGFARFEDNASGPDVRFLKSRGATIGANVIVQDGDTLGRFRFQGADGGDFNTTAAEVLGRVDGTPGLNDIPGRVVIRTRIAGGSLADRAIIDNVGNLNLLTGTFFLTEQAAANADVAGRGQIWVKTATPNELFFTDDAGTDHQLGTGGGGGTPTLIEDADQDTKVQTEESADEDIIRMDVFGTERFVLQDASPHLAITGNVDVSGVSAFGNNRTVSANIVVGAGQDFSLGSFGIGEGFTAAIADIGAVDGGTALSLRGVVGSVENKRSGTRTVNALIGLEFAAVHAPSVASTTNILIGAKVTSESQVSTGAIITMTGIQLNQVSGSGDVAPATVYGFHAKYSWAGSDPTDVYSFKGDAVAFGTNRYGLHLPDIGGGTIARILELGPSTPYLRLLGSGEWTPAANETPLYLTEGATPTLRQVKHKSGTALVAGDKVLVLV